MATKKKDPADYLPRGQPTKYKPEYCQRLIDHMALGKSYEHFAASINVSKQSLYEWEKVHPEFSDAKRQAVLKCMAWWEDQGQEGLWDVTDYVDGKPLKSKKLNAGVWMYNMKCRFKEHWLDQKPEEEKDKTPLSESQGVILEELAKELIKRRA